MSLAEGNYNFFLLNYAAAFHGCHLSQEYPSAYIYIFKETCLNVSNILNLMADYLRAKFPFHLFLINIQADKKNIYREKKNGTERKHVTT